MKLYYKISLGIITILFAAIFYNFIDSKTEIAEILQLSAIFVALFTSVLAISISDKKKERIGFSMDIFGLKKKGKSDYVLSELDSSIQSHFKKHGDSFSSYQVYFKIRNKSKFNLKRPTVTIRVPSRLKHPSQDYRNLEFRSNLFNSTNSFQMLEYGDTTIVSNSNLPYLHKNEVLKIWIRMVLNPLDEKKLTFHVALDSENLEGKYEMISMSPKAILENIEK